MNPVQHTNHTFDDIIGIDGDAVNAFAKQAIVNSAQIKCDMACDDGGAIPTEADIREFALDFIANQLDTFKAEVLSKMKGVEFTARVRIDPTIVFSVDDW